MEAEELKLKDLGITAEMIEAGAETILEFDGPQPVSVIACSVYVAMEVVRRLQHVKPKGLIH